jgi:glycine cleavage system H lipoate-binding protein
MKAGIINFKLCDNAYDCVSCPFDKAMTRKMEQKSTQAVSWRKVMRGKRYDEKECRHMLTGRVEYRLCANAYQCNICEFDQGLDERDLLRASKASAVREVSGFQVADGYYYHRGHSWARIEHGGLVRIGIDDFALHLVGHVSAIELPKLGTQLDQTDIGWQLHREDKTARMLGPMEGVVLATNHKVLDRPDLAKHDPYGDGWLMVVEPSHLRQNLKNLLFEREADAWVGSEAHRLDALVMNSYGMSLAATGGEIVDDIYGNLPGADWDQLMHEFLLT